MTFESYAKDSRVTTKPSRFAGIVGARHGVDAALKSLRGIQEKAVVPESKELITEAIATLVKLQAVLRPEPERDESGLPITDWKSPIFRAKKRAERAANPPPKPKNRWLGCDRDEAMRKLRGGR